MQLKEKVERYFNIYPGLRILFLFDAEADFKEEAESLQLDDIKVVQWESNYFYLKVMLHGEWKRDKVLLYFPFDSPHISEDYHSFPLLDLLEANNELLMDDEADFMEEYKLQRHHRDLVKRYMRELKYTSVQEVCKPILSPAALEEKALQKGLISSFLRFKQIEPWSVLLAKILTLILPGQEDELKRFTNKIIDNDLIGGLQKQTQHYFEHSLSNINRDSIALLLKIIRYNQLTLPITKPSKEDPYASLKINKRDTLTRMNQLIQEALIHERIAEKFEEALQVASESIHGEKLIEVYGIDAEYGYLTPAMAWALISSQQENLDYNPKAAITRLEALSLQPDLSNTLQGCLHFMIQTAKMISQINSIASFTLNKPEQYLQQYTDEWYQIDQSYRKGIQYRKRLDNTEIPEYFQIEQLCSLLNKRYEEFTEKLNREWLKCLAEFQFDYQKLSIPKQYEFYSKEVAPYDQKVVVIISDALRYECAKELLAEMHGDPKNTADIRYQLAGLPSKTSVGMAQLLPGKSFQYNEGRITIDGMPTDGLENRNKILETSKPDSKAVQFADLERWTQKQNREIFKAPVVYVYHDVIDSTGDKRPSERRTFTAVEEAIKELAKFVKTLHATYNVARVIVTADHGFLYNDREIEEKDKENGSGLDTIDKSNRFEIIKGHAQPIIGYAVPLRATSLFTDDLSVVIPESVNRYKKQGVGHQFAHGGGSLQELIVPIIESSRKLQAVTKKVQPILVNDSNLRIVSNILRVNLLQKNKVSRHEKEIELVIGLYKDYELVSNEVNLHMSSTADSPSERMHRLELILMSAAANESFLKLKVFDIKDKLNPIIEKRVDNNTLIQQDF